MNSSLNRPRRGTSYNPGGGSGGGGGGLTSLPAAKMVVVDAGSGNDGTGAAHDLSKPFATLEAAVAAATSGDVVVVRPGAYTPLGNLAKNGVDWLFSPGAIVTYAPVSPTHALFDLAGGLTSLQVEGNGQFILSATGTPDSSKFTLFSDSGAGTVTKFIFEADSVVDTTGFLCAGGYGSASDVLNIRIKLLDASLNVHAVRSPVTIGRCINRWGAIQGVTFTLSAITKIDVYLQTGTPGGGAYPIVCGEYLEIGNVELGSFELHEVHFKVLRQLVEANLLCQVKVTQGPCVIDAYLTAFNGVTPGPPLIIATTDPVTFNGVIDMKDCNYAFPIQVSGSLGACTLKTQGCCLLQNDDPAGFAIRVAIFGISTPFLIYCSAGSTLSFVREGSVFTNQNPDTNVTFVSSFEDRGSPLTTNTGTSLTLDRTMEVVTLNNALAVAVSLPPLVDKIGLKAYRIKNLGAGTVTVTANGAETIFTTSAVSSFQLATGDSVDLIATPATWLVS